MNNRHLLQNAFLSFLAVLVSLPANAAKTDVVALINGDTVTGEVKSLDFGSLSYSTDSMGTVTIDWEDVTALTSNQHLQVEDVVGRRYFGQLLESGEERKIRVRTSSETVTLDTAAISRITPIEADDRFLERLDGSFSFGLQAQRSSEVNTSNVAADISYRARKYLVGLRLQSTVTDQPSEETKASQSLDLNYQRFRDNRWFSDWFAGWERDDELGIQARISAGAAWGRYFVQTNQHQLSVTAGAQASRERYIGEDAADTVPEGRIEVRYLFRKVEPEARINFTTQLYPQLNDLSEYRATSSLNYRWELIEDVFWDFGINYSYTSDPPTGAEKSDASLTTSLGYSF